MESSDRTSTVTVVALRRLILAAAGFADSCVFFPLFFFDSLLLKQRSRADLRRLSMCVERIIDSHYFVRISDPHVILRGTAEDICPFFLRVILHGLHISAYNLFVFSNQT